MTPSEEIISKLEKSNEHLRQSVEQHRRKIHLIQEALLQMGDCAVVPTDHALADLASVETKFIANANVTILAFGGMLTQLGMPPREFFKSIEKEHCNIIFVKDFFQNWYQNGVMGLSHNLPETVTALQKIIPSSTTNLRTLGTSSGGFAAIYFGACLGADRIVAFGPQTKVKPRDFEKFGSIDSRVSEYDFGDENSDLAKVISSIEKFEGKIDIYFAQNNCDDK